MSSTAKDKLATLKGEIDSAQRIINHDNEWREVVTELREHLRLSLSNASKYNNGHASAIDGR